MQPNNPTPPAFPRTSPLLILPSVPVDVITPCIPSSFNPTSNPSTIPSGQSTQKTAKRMFTLRIFRSGDGETGKGIRFEMTDEGDGETCEVVKKEGEDKGEGGNEQGQDSIPATPSHPPAPPSDDVTLYTLEVYEDDFHILKSSQSLLVDFPDFPTMLISVLENTKDGGFTARLTEGTDMTCTLTVVEPSRFKELTHLNLKVRKCNDREIRPYLSQRVNELTGRLREAREKEIEGERERNILQGQVGDLKEEISKERLERENVVRSVRLEMGEKGREVELTNQRLSRDMVEAARREFQSQSEALKEQLEKERAKGEKEREERERKVKEMFEVQAEARSLSIDLETRTRLVEKVTADNKELQEKITEKEGMVFKLERENHKVQLQMAAMEQSAGQQIENERKMEEQREEWIEAKTTLTKQNELLSGKIEQLESKVSRASREIEKGNGIISRLQQEHRQVKQRLKLKTEALRNSEISLAQKTDELGEINRKYNAINGDHEVLKSSYAQSQVDLTSARAKLTESSKLLDSNHQVITWLNKEINEAQLGRVSAYGGATNEKVENKYVPSYTPDLKVSKGLGAYISPEGGGGLGAYQYSG